MELLNLKLTLNQDGSITANWSEITGAVRYHIYMGPVGKSYLTYNEKNITATSYTSAGNLDANQQYRVVLVAYGSSDMLADDGAQILIPYDFYRNLPLTVPQNVRATADTVSVTVSFDEVDNARSYDILFDDTVYNVTTTSKKFTGLKPKTSHTYAVRAKNTNNTTAYSTTQSITTLALSPAVPTNIRKTATEIAATISWGAVNGATGYDIEFNGTTYNVSDTTKMFTGLTAGKAYPFAVRSKNADADSAYTAQATVTTAPKAPTTISATCTDKSVTINWNAVSGAAGYTVYFHGTKYEVPATSTSKTFNGLTSKTSYSYQICCKSVDGSGSYSSAKSITTLAPLPAVPTNIKKTATSNSASISWNAVSGATGYNLQFNGTTYSVTGTAKSFTGLTANQSYPFKVCAKNGTAAGSYSAEMTVTTAPGAPASVSAVSTDNSVTVSWSAVSGAAGYTVSFNGTKYEVAATSTSKTFTGLSSKTSYSYQVCCKSVDGSGSYSSAKSITTLAPLPAVPTNIKKTATGNSATISWGAVSGATAYYLQFDGTTYSVTGTSKTISSLAANQSYPFKVCARNGSTTGNYSAEMTVTTAPAAPTTVSAVSTDSSVTVNWGAVSGAAGYTVSFNGAKYEVAAASTSKTVTGLTANTSYSYQVCSKSVDGSGAYSTLKTIKTLVKGLNIPTGITHKSTENSVAISWNAVSGASGYDVLFNAKTYSVTGTSREFTGLSANTTYFYQVRSRISSGTVGSYSASQTVKTTPAAPASTDSTTSENSVTVSWNAVPGADSYDLLFNGKVYHVTETSHTVTGLAANTSYSYQVRVNNADGSSAYGSSKTVKTAPKAPASPAVTTTKNSVTVSWNAVTGATSYDLLFNGTTYRVTGTSKTIAGLTPGTSYSYQIRSNNEDGSSTYCASQSVSTLPNPPATPTNISATSTVNSVTITWDAVSGATSYDVLWGSTAYHVTGTSKTVTGLTTNTSYTYQVRANNAGGNSNYSSSKTIKTLPGAPGVPTNIKANPSSYSVVVSWSAVAGATGYDLLFNGSVYNATTVSKAVNGLKPSTTYTYQVRAKNAGGTSAYSAAAKVTTLVSPPAVPSNITATATTGSITVKWDAVSGATNYYVSFNGAAYGGTSTSRTFTGLESGTEYSYSVRAVNAGGTSGYSAPQTIRTIPVVPAAPQAVKAFADAHAVEVSWNAVSGVDSYELLFDGKAYTLTGSLKRIEGLEANTEYTYQVRAENEAGVSAYSELQVVRTRLEAVQNVRAEATSKTVTLSFDAVDGATVYEILFGINTYQVTETFIVLEGLTPETEYKYAVCAKNEYVDGVGGQMKIIKTLRPGPAMPSDITAMAAMDSIIVSWSPVEGAEDYDIRFDDIDYHVTESGTTTLAEQEEPAKSVVAAMFSVSGMRKVKAAAYDGAVGGGIAGERIYKIFTGLKPNTRHSYCARANNAEGSSLYTETKYVTTDIQKSNGLAQVANRRTYPDGRRTYTGNDPINALTGAFLWSYTWLEDHGKDGLHFTTMYDSQRDAGGGILGKKWTHSLNYLLFMDEEYAYFYTPYDEVTAFGRNTEDGSFQPADGAAASYRMKENEDGSYSVKALDGTEYIFDNKLCLDRIMENGLVTYRFRSDDAGQIVRMEGQYGAGMDITYADGRIASVADAMGNTVSFVYENGKLASVTNPDGREMSFTYDAAWNLLTITDFSGEVYLTNTYDVQGRVTGQLTAGRGRSYAAYDEENHATSFTDERGNVTSYTYDDAGHIISVVLAGKAIYNSYNEKGQMTEQTDALGNTTKMEYDDYGRMSRVIYPDGTEERVTYNDRNQPSRVVGRDGAVNLYQYDEHNNLIEMQDERGNTSSYTYDENDNLTSFTDKNGNVWTYGYDSGNHLEQAADPDGNICFYTHDAIGRMTSYTSPAGRTVSYRYSAAGDLLGIGDADGEMIFEYNENGSRTGITDRMGNKQRLEYNEMGQVSLATDCLGNEYRFAYDGRGSLVTETDPLGYSVSHTYDASGNRTSLTDKNGGVTHFCFDAADRLIQVKDAAGGTVSYTYDCMGQVTAVTDQLSHQKLYAYDQAGRVLSETDALEHSVSYTYDEAGNLLTRTDEDGSITSYTYDAENRLLSIQTDAGVTAFTYDRLGRILSVTDTDGYAQSAEYDSDGNLTASSDKENRRTSYAYDDMGRLSEETAPNGGKTAYAYDKNGNCVQITDAEGHVYSYEYDANNRLVKTTDPLGRESAFAYDGRGQMTRITDARGGITEYSYDGNGNLIREVNPLGGEKTYVYDSLDRLTGSTDEEGNTWSCTYDAAGNRTSFTDANRNRWTYGYDANNRLISVTGQNEGNLTLDYTNTGRVSGVTDMEGAVTGYEYDALGRLTRITGAMGHSLSFTYDSTGRLLTQTDANGNTTEYGYSPAGNLLSVTDAEGGTTAYTYNALGQVLTKEDALGNRVSYTYDLLGQVTSLTDALGGTTAFTYTADGRIATVENAEGNLTRYTYDACGNLTQTEDPLGNVVLYEYDAMNHRIRECLSESGEYRCVTLYQYDKKGRMIKEINPVLEEKTYGYDGNDNLVSVTDEEQRETVVTYDLNNRPVSMTYSDGRRAAFRYNKRGELVEMQDWNGATAMERDSLGRLTGVTDPDGRMTGFAYDAAGNRTGIRYPDGSAAAYAYDRNNRLLKVTEGTDASGENTGEILAQYGYDAAGSVISLTQPGSMASYTYNANRQPVKAAYRFGGGAASAENPGEISMDIFMEESFTYDIMGRITGSRRTGSRAEFSKTAAYAYDALGQLISCQSGQTVEAYTYDALGNRTARSLDGIPKTAYRYNALNQLTALSEDGVTCSFAYDKCGSLTQERRGDDLLRQYAYDTGGRMVLGKNLEGGGETAYTYNALGMCVKNVQKPGAEDAFREMRYVPDFLSGTNNELMAYGTDGCSIRTVFGHAYQRLAQSASVGKTFFQSDIYGSPVFAADGQGQLKQYAGRDVWGSPEPGTDILPGLEENLRFTSYRYDPVIDKYFAQARFYDSANGRMLSKDPVKRGLNPYRYCDNDPVDYVDPTGEILSILGGAVLGGFFGGAAGFVGSAVSQAVSGEKFDGKKALGAAANGAVTGAAQGALIGSGAGIPLALAVNFAAGTAGSAAEQYISTGKVDAGKSVTNGLTNAVSNLIYGTGKLGSAKEAFLRGAGAGAATSAINYISDVLGNRQSVMSGTGTGAMSGISAGAVSPYEMLRDPRRGCGSVSPFTPSIGYRSAKGYQYSVPETETVSQSQKKGFSLKDFAFQTAMGGVIGGVASAAFYGAGKGIERLKESVQARKGGKETELFLPDEFYNKNLPGQVTPGTKYLPKYDEFGNVKQIKMYDDFGREIGWVDYTNHGYGDISSPDYHTVPHWHERIYNAQNRDGMKINHRTDTNTPLGDK